jgi:hypothetical protein
LVLGVDEFFYFRVAVKAINFKAL